MDGVVIWSCTVPLPIVSAGHCPRHMQGEATNLIWQPRTTPKSKKSRGGPKQAGGSSWQLRGELSGADVAHGTKSVMRASSRERSMSHTREATLGACSVGCQSSLDSQNGAGRGGSARRTRLPPPPPPTQRRKFRYFSPHSAYLRWPRRQERLF